MRIKPIMSIIAVVAGAALFTLFPFNVALSLFITIGSFSAFIAWGLGHDAKIAKQHANTQKASFDLLKEYKTLLSQVEAEKYEMSRLLAEQSELLNRLIDLNHKDLLKQNTKSNTAQKQLAAPLPNPTPEEKKIQESQEKLMLLIKKFPLCPDHAITRAQLRSLIKATKKHHGEYRHGFELLLEQHEIYISKIIKEFEKSHHNIIGTRPTIFSNPKSVRAQLFSKANDKPRNLKPKKKQYKPVDIPIAIEDVKCIRSCYHTQYG